MEKLAIGFYTIGAFASWVIVGPLAGWNQGATTGATVALLGVLLGFICLWIGWERFFKSLAVAALFASFPTGILVDIHTDGSWFKTLLWIAGSGGVVLLLSVASAKVREKWGT